MVNESLCAECNDTHEIPETRLVAGPEDVDETETVICLSCPQCAQCDRFVSDQIASGYPAIHIDDLWFCGDDRCFYRWVRDAPSADDIDLHAERVLLIALEFTRMYLDGKFAPDIPRDCWNDDGELLALANAVTRFRREASRQVSHHAMLSRIEAENAEIERAALEAGEPTGRETRA